MNTALTRTVYGESVSDLLPALVVICREMRPVDGGYGGTFTLEPEEAAPFLRALMRVQADLLREDADSIGLPGSENAERTHDQRAADALVQLFQAVGACVSSRT